MLTNLNRAVLSATMKARSSLLVNRTCILVVLSLAFWSTSSYAAFPRLLMVYGAPLAKPVVVENALDVVKIFEGDSDGTAEQELAGRPYLQLALFWGAEWNRYMEEGKLAGALTPDDVTPFGDIPIRGRFYPACGNRAAQISLNEGQSQGTKGIWQVPADGLTVLESLGVPTKREC